MNYAQLRKYDIANGKGIRTTIFVSGCRFACKSCFNLQYQDFKFGQPFTENTLNTILEYLSDENVSGLSVLGGEPLMQEIEDLDLLLGTVKHYFPNKDIWLWTGYKYEEIPSKYHSVLKYIDVLVDGKFIETKKDIKLRWRGSSNQRIINVQESLKQGKIIERLDLY